MDFKALDEDGLVQAIENCAVSIAQIGEAT